MWWGERGRRGENNEWNGRNVECEWSGKNVEEGGRTNGVGKARGEKERVRMGWEERGREGKMERMEWERNGEGGGGERDEREGSRGEEEEVTVIDTGRGRQIGRGHARVAREQKRTERRKMSSSEVRDK